jgi:hypothetical protein
MGFNLKGGFGISPRGELSALVVLDFEFIVQTRVLDGGRDLRTDLHAFFDRIGCHDTPLTPCDEDLE